MCAVIVLDVRNVFNSAKWYNIMLALENLEVLLYLRRTIFSYLTERILLYDTDDGMHFYNITGGVPQSSVVGSQIWNVLYDRKKENGTGLHGMGRYPLRQWEGTYMPRRIVGTR